MQWSRSLPLMVAFVLCGTGALAADPTPVPIPQPAGDAALTDKVDNAIAAATSYRIAVSGPSGVSLDIREFGPDRVRIVSGQGEAETESILVGNTMYYKTATTAWRAYPIPPIKKVRKNRLYMAAADTLLEPLADRNFAGEVLGSFRSPAAGNGQVPGVMECTYEKATYRPRVCVVTLQGISAPLQVTYAGWDDPANAVEPPPGVAAPLGGTPPVPAPSPRPGGSAH